jgi:hypothetical protein
MFEAVGQSLQGDHLDLSYRNTGSWTRVGPGFDVPSLWISLGDAVAGPAVQLGLCPPLSAPQDVWLDAHYHGSDQFRALLLGKFLLQNRHMVAGQFVYQEAGRPYREGLVGGCTEDSWMFGVHGERRGARTTVVRHDGTLIIPEDQIAADQQDRYIDSPTDPYWNDVPGGSKGIAAVATTHQSKHSTFIWGSFGDTAKWRAIDENVSVMAGAFGHKEAGPIILTLHCEPDRVALPSLTAATELLVVVVRGSVRMGTNRYEKGEVRIQKSDVPLDSIAVGAEGADVVLMIADRRAQARIEGQDGLAKNWREVLDGLYSELVK